MARLSVTRSLCLSSATWLLASGMRFSKKTAARPDSADEDFRRSGPTQQNSYPEFSVPSGYVDPLSSAGLAQEQSMMTALDEATYENYITTLTDPSIGSLGVASRFAKNAAVMGPVLEYLSNEFQALGVTTCTQTLSVGWSDKYDVTNVIGFVPGTEPGLVVFGAHYDDLPSRGPAPGAVDNGSGTAGILSALKAFMASGAKPKKSIYFVAFGGEEQGYDGSARLVKELKSPSSSASAIPAACLAQGAASDTIGVTVDMIGWRDPKFSEDTVLMETYSQYTDLLLPPLAKANEVTNGNKLKLTYSTRPFGSDHMSFLRNGFPGILAIDNDGDTSSYPCYHRSCDDASYVSSRLGSEITKMNLGAVLRLAGLN